MKAVMSMMTRTPEFRMRRETLLIWTLSICLAVRAFGRVHYSTDRFGQRIAGTLGWGFASTDLRLQEIPDRIRPVWAVGKAYAVRDTLSLIHI